MHQLKTAIRLALCVGLIASAAIWVSLACGILENPAARDAQHRTTVARYVSLIASSLINSNRKAELQSTMEQLILSEPALESVGIRDPLGRVITAGPHETTWPQHANTLAAKSTIRGESNDVTTDLAAHQISVELIANGRDHGSIELAFQSEMTSLWKMFFGFPVPLAAFVGAFVSLTSWIIFERSFKYLDPSQVVPDRVRAALDTMAEGVVLLDTNSEIGHANGAFTRIVGKESGRLLGTSIFDYEWSQSSDFGTNDLPWSQALKEQRPVCGIVVRLMLEDAPTRKFIVNATPIVSSNNECRGVLVSLEDVTAMENKKHELSQMIATLRQSRDEVERQNTKLNFLASFDQLTECLNRRVFYKRLNAAWADESVKDLSVIMLDVDNFKGVNDNHGHGKGDEVLKEVGRLLRESVGESGIVARMGGEEFAAMLPSVTLGPAILLAEELRTAICGSKVGGLDITISSGVSAKELLPMDPQHLLDQADQALYAAKNAGRNRVVRYDKREEMASTSASAGDGVTDSQFAAQDVQAADGNPSFENSRDQAEEIAEEVQDLVHLTSSHASPRADQQEPDGRTVDQPKADEVAG